MDKPVSEVGWFLQRGSWTFPEAACDICKVHINPKEKYYVRRDKTPNPNFSIKTDFYGDGFNYTFTRLCYSCGETTSAMLVLKGDSDPR